MSNPPTDTRWYISIGLCGQQIKPSALVGARLVLMKEVPVPGSVSVCVALASSFINPTIKHKVVDIHRMGHFRHLIIEIFHDQEGLWQSREMYIFSHSVLIPRGLSTNYSPTMFLSRPCPCHQTVSTAHGPLQIAFLAISPARKSAQQNALLHVLLAKSVSIPHKPWVGF